MNISISTYAKGLHQVDDVWYTLNRTAISYPEEGNEGCFEVEESSFWFQHRNDCILSALVNFPPLVKTIFDVGGGNGVVSEAIQNAGFEMYLIEPGNVGVINAKRRGIKHIISGSVQDIEFQENTLPAIGLFDIIEHITADKNFLGELKRFLMPSGKIYITVPAYQWLWSKQDEFAGHYRRYTLAQLEKLLQKAGYKVEYSTYIFSMLLMPIFLLRTLPDKLHLFGDKAETNIEAVKKGHRLGGGLIGKMLRPIWRWELRVIEKQKKLPIGASCLIVASKT